MSRRLAPVLFGLLSIAAPAAADFDIKLKSFVVDGAYVSISPVVVSLGPCAGYTCTRYRHYVTIEPCPPDGVCTYDFEYSLNLKLAYGTSYRITGYSVVQAGPLQGTCTFPCQYTTPTTSTTYDVVARDETGNWTLTPVEHSGSNVWVELGVVSDFIDYSPCSRACWESDVQIIVSPCPLAARYYLPNRTDPIDLPVNCIDGAATFVLGYLRSPDPPLEFLLAPGDYDFDGHFATLFFLPEHGGGCAEACAYFSVYPPPAEYSTDPLAVRTTTWGRVKALYRE